MFLRGGCIDKIIALGSVLEPDILVDSISDKGDTIHSLYKWHNDSLLVAVLGTDIRSVMLDFWKLLIGHRSLSQRPASTSIKMYYDIRLQRRQPKDTASVDPPLADSSDHIPATLAWTEAMESHALSRRVCVTAAGKMGLVSSGTQVDDEMVLIFGATTPFVVRHPHGPCNEASGECGEPFQLVGECYIRGCMEREGLKNIVPSNGSMLEFVEHSGSFLLLWFYAKQHHLNLW